MEIYPALDLFEGQCVRLKKGDFQDKTVYSEDPKETTRWIESLGAKNLHLVDLSGAKDPSQRQIGLIQQLISNSSLRIQCGGGIRSYQDIQSLLDLGLDRVVLGSIAIKNPTLTVDLIHAFQPHRITLALDVRVDSRPFIEAREAVDTAKVVIEGWRRTSEKSLADWIAYYQDMGINRVLCTDVNRDGMLSGPNFILYQGLVARFPQIEFQASGGISCLDDLKALREFGIHSVIIGKSFYEGKVSVQEALLAC